MTRHNRSRTSNSQPEANAPSSYVIIRLDCVLWEFARQYRALSAASNPGRELSVDQAAIAAAHIFEESGDAIRLTDADGNITWKLTTNFLRRSGRQAHDDRPNASE
jgi:hypothetical protein